MGNDTTAAGSHLTHEIVADWQQYRRLREYAFFGVSGFVMVLLVTLGTWLRTLSVRVFDGSMQVDMLHAAMFLAPVFVMASLVAASLLPMIRFVFQQHAKTSHAKDDAPIWPTLITEATDILKSYIGRGKSAN